MQVQLRVEAVTRAGDDVLIAEPAVSVSVRPDDPSVIASQGIGYSGTQGAQFDLTGTCRLGCSGGVTIVVRAGPGLDPTDVGLRTSLVLTDSSYKTPPTDAMIEVGEDDPPAGRIPTVSTAAISPVIRVSSAQEIASIQLVLHADERLLAAPLELPRVGSLSIRLVGQGEAHQLLWRPSAGGSTGFATVGGAQYFLAGESWPFEVDWLRLCQPHAPCDIPFTVTADYRHIASEARVTSALQNQTSPPIPNSFSFTVEVTAAYEAFDGAAIPANSLELTVRP